MTAYDRRHGDDDAPNYIVIRGPGAGAWEGVWFDLSLMGWGDPDDMGGRFQPTGDVEFRGDGACAQVYRHAAPPQPTDVDVAATEHRG